MPGQIYSGVQFDAQQIETGDWVVMAGCVVVAYCFVNKERAMALATQLNETVDDHCKESKRLAAA